MAKKLMRRLFLWAKINRERACGFETSRHFLLNHNQAYLQPRRFDFVQPRTDRRRQMAV
jgi:hypothetical protein